MITDVIRLKQMKRKAIPNSVRVSVLTECGYRCAVPTCRGILALDLHHIEYVSEKGDNSLSNLIALCPTCHALHHRGTIPQESISIWKNMLVVLTNAFDTETVDRLLFLTKPGAEDLVVSGDGILQFYRVIAADLAKHRRLKEWSTGPPRGPVQYRYTIELTPKGKRLLDAWVAGDLGQLKQVVAAG